MFTKMLDILDAPTVLWDHQGRDYLIDATYSRKMNTTRTSCNEPIGITYYDYIRTTDGKWWRAYLYGGGYRVRY